MRALMNKHSTLGIAILFCIILSQSIVCLAEEDEEAFSELERTLRGDASFSRIYRSNNGDDDKRSETQFSRIYRQSSQPSFARILRGGPASFSRILRGGPASFSRILRGGESLSRILRSEAPASGSAEDEKRISRLLKAPEFSRLLRSQTFSRILKRSGGDDDEDLYMDEDGEVAKKRGMNDFSRILRSPPSFARIL